MARPEDIRDTGQVRAVLSMGQQSQGRGAQSLNKADAVDVSGTHWTLRAPVDNPGFWTAEQNETADREIHLVIDLRAEREYGSEDGVYECRSQDWTTGAGTRWEGDDNREHQCNECPFNRWGSDPGGTWKACGSKWLIQLVGKNTDAKHTVMTKAVKMSPSTAKQRKPWEEKPEEELPLPDMEEEIQRALASIQDSAGEELPQEVMRAISLEREPGRSVTVRDRKGTVLASISKQENGQFSTGTKGGQITHLPDPDPERKENGYRAVGNEITDRVIGEAAEAMLTRHLNHDRKPFSAKLQGWNALQQAIEICREGGRATASKEVSETLAGHVAEMVDRETWEMTKLLQGQVNIYKYNEVTKCPSLYRDLSATNPGIAAWSLCYGTAKEDMNHPGQLVSAVRDDMMAKGLKKSNWKFISKLSPEHVRATTTQGAMSPVAILNALADNQILPPPRAIAGPLRRFMEADQYLRGEILQSQTAKANIEKAARFLCRELLREEEEELEVDENQVADYLSHLAREDMELAATNWNGVIRRTREWHEQMAQVVHTMTPAEIDRSQRNWNSLLEAVEIGGVTAVPLKSGMDLHEEAKIMNHCVHGYDNQCAQGTSRIFSIRVKNERTATAEMRIFEGTWRTVQVRGNSNMRVTEDIKAASETLAQMYQAEWDKTPDPRHRAWAGEKRIL